LLAEHLGPERQIVIAREISKLYQETIRLTLGQAAEQIKDESLRGELVLVVQGAA
jgi:16S rRNA (cytidine1402-2'-O)-methyltransferase